MGGEELNNRGRKEVETFVRSVLDTYSDPIFSPRDLEGSTKRFSQDWNVNWNDGTVTSHFLQVLLTPSEREDRLAIVWCHAVVKGCFMSSFNKLKKQMMWECFKEVSKLNMGRKMIRPAVSRPMIDNAVNVTEKDRDMELGENVQDEQSWHPTLPETGDLPSRPLAIAKSPCD